MNKKYLVTQSAIVGIFLANINIVYADSSASLISPSGAINANVEVEVKPIFGRGPSEYFFTPIVGLNATDITGISSTFFTSDSRSINNNNNTINVNNSELATMVGFLFDAQYQITSIDYWRAGFQTGLLYNFAADSEFTAEVCDTPVSSDCGNTVPTFSEDGTLEISSWSIPVLFTFSRYAAHDRYIVTLKLGPTINFERYATDFPGFDVYPSSEAQVAVAVGIDGRYRLGESDNFLLVGFMGEFIGNGGNNNGFSGVDSVNNFNVYVGYSFS